MKTLTKTKLAVKTAVGIALIGGFALAAGGFGWRIYKKYNPILSIQPTRVTNGNIAGSNITDVDQRCERMAYNSIYNGKYFFQQDNGSAANSYPFKDYVCFSNNGNSGDNGDYIGVGSSTGDINSSPDVVVGGPAVAGSNYSNQNAKNNFCCDIKKYYDPGEIYHCKSQTYDTFGRVKTDFAKCGKINGVGFACLEPASGKIIKCASNRSECQGLLQGEFTAACPIFPKSCNEWGQTNDRGRAGFDLCAQNGYEGVCVNKFTGYYIGCKKPGENKCTYINIYSAPRERDVNLEADASVCDTGYKAISKSCQVWVNDINSVAGKQANISKQNCAAAGYSRVCVNKFTGEAAGCATKGSNQCYNVNFNTGEATLGLNLVSNSDLDACSTGVQDKIIADSFCDPLFKKQAYLAKAQACISRSTGSEEFYGLCLNESLGGTVYNAGENGCLSNLNSESCAAAGGHTCWLKDFATGEYKYGLTR